MKLTRYTTVDVNKDGVVTHHGDLFLDNDEIVGVTIILDMHGVVVNHVARILLRPGGAFTVQGTPREIAEKLNDVV